MSIRGGHSFKSPVSAFAETGKTSEIRLWEVQSMTADWPTTGAVPVFIDRDGGRDIVGYTTFTLRQPGVSRYTMTKKLEGDPLGAFRMVGEAEVFERQTPEGCYLAWLVISGDPKDMPDFWPV
jgi:hypothetical protein